MANLFANVQCEWIYCWLNCHITFLTAFSFVVDCLAAFYISPSTFIAFVFISRSSLFACLLNCFVRML